ncbi:recombinase family protein [Zoogloea sp.]|uniref:recombinase family protein n=1 Tax=Zoogloea sp. TaxID=49181 RepID=UPI0031FCEE9D
MSADIPACKILAAEYVRMSTDHQRYSTENQTAVIRKYAESHGMLIEKSYADEGKSGLDISGREALRRLIADVQSGTTTFKVILVYDVSRWGRFQNADESAHYEYLCTRAGVTVIYCAEQFENDGSPVSAIVKSVKRAMAGEYSRELSTKVFLGQCRLVELGFHQGGAAGYGLRRALIDDQRNQKGLLDFRQHKSIHTDRVILVPGPEDEIQTVRRIYDCFVTKGMNEASIAEMLNNEGLLTDLGRKWTRGTVHQLLTNEKYIGNSVYNRMSFKLKQHRVRNTPDRWIRCDNAFKSIVSKEIFESAVEIIAKRSARFSNDEMLKLLDSLYSRLGVLSGLIIDEQEGMPSSSAYRSRFGGLLRAYKLINYQPNRDYRYLEINQNLRKLHPEVIEHVTNLLINLGAIVSFNTKTNLLAINNDWSVSVVIARCHRLSSGTLRWHIRFDTGLSPDITIAVRMDSTNLLIRDYYLIPRLDIGSWPSRFAEENDRIFEGYRFESLDILGELAARCPIEEAA